VAWDEAYGELTVTEKNGVYSLVRTWIETICEQMTKDVPEVITQVEGQEQYKVEYNAGTDDEPDMRLAQVKFMYTVETVDGDQVKTYLLNSETGEKLYYNPRVSTNTMIKDENGIWVLRPGALLEGDDPEVIILGPVLEESGLYMRAGAMEDGELRQEAVIKKYLITASDGKRYNMNHYNLQAIIAVGFKVNNQRAVQFRKWAGQIVKDYTIQGWTMDHQSIPDMNPGKNDIRRGALGAPTIWHVRRIGNRRAPTDV